MFRFIFPAKIASELRGTKHFRILSPAKYGLFQEIKEHILNIKVLAVNILVCFLEVRQNLGGTAFRHTCDNLKCTLLT
jgi:hypothetical protein